MKRNTAILLAVICAFVLLLAPGQRADASAASPTAGRVATQSTPLNVRANASASSAVVGSLARGSYVTLMEKSGSWWRVMTADGAYGYCADAYITRIAGSEAMTVTTASTALNVRSGPSTAHAVLGQLPKGKTVVRISSSGGFAQILYNGTRVGYASMAYLSATNGARATNTTAYPALNLGVQGFKQTDARWASVKVGGTGRTIAQIGCATTALAMTESHRLGTTLTPAAMASRLRYTSGGAVYWPAEYAVGGAMGYAAIYEKLKAGTPVILGGRAASGSTHFVVVTGYAGGNALNAAGFSINDPGSNTRMTLGEFLGAFPTIYRSVYAR